MSDLVLCTECERHVTRPVDLGEAHCPFCTAVITAPPPSLVAQGRGLSRSKLFALHTAALATTVVTAVACGGESANTGTNTANDVKTDVADAGSNHSAVDSAVQEQWRNMPPPPYGCVFPGACTSIVV